MRDESQDASWAEDQRRRIDELIEEYGGALLGLAPRATFVEGVWFDRAITGRSNRWQ